MQLYGKDEKSTLLGCFVDGIKNMDNVLCINALVDGVPQLMSVDELFGKQCRLQAILRSGPLKDSKNGKHWSLNVTEVQIDKIPDNYEGYFRTATPKLKFLK